MYVSHAVLSGMLKNMQNIGMLQNIFNIQLSLVQGVSEASEADEIVF